MQQQEISLLVRADDMGSSHAANVACRRVCEEGICRTVELMPPCPWFPEAVAMLKEMPGCDVGLHLTLTSEWANMKWGPVSGARSIVTDGGWFYTRSGGRVGGGVDPDALLDADWKPKDVEMELRAQIELALKHVPRLTHMGIHMGGSRADPRIGEIRERLAQEYGMVVNPRDAGFQRFAGFGRNRLTITAEQKIETLVENLENVGPGRWFFVEHPGLDVPEMGALDAPHSNVSLDRAGVTAAWTNERVKEVVSRRGIRLVSYADVKKGVPE
jgi:predicted glycoside hydrolase/deacetylase ChbG (UPF0249 family)